MASEPRTIVVGAGIVGLSVAYALLRRGRAVTVLDRDTIDEGCSTGNAGVIALGHAPMPRPGMVRQALRMFFDPANPLYIPPRFDMDLLRFLWGFRRACTPRQFEISMNVLAEMGWITGECFDQIVDDEGIDGEYHRTGWREVFRSHQRFEQGREEAELLKRYGYDAEIISGEELRARDPAFHPGIIGAVHYTDSRFANPKQFMVEFGEAVKKRGGDVREKSPVTRLITDGDRVTGVETERGERIEGSQVVLACGIWTTRLAESVGVNVPMQAGKGYHIRVTRPEPCINTACVCAETYVACTPIDGQLQLGGTVEFSGINHRMVRKRIDMLKAGAKAYLRGVEEAEILSEWCGLRPCTADGLPVIGPAPRVGGLYLATGHAMMGFCLGPATGRLISELILDGKTSMDITPMLPERYDRARAAA